MVLQLVYKPEKELQEATSASLETTALKTMYNWFYRAVIVNSINIELLSLC